ncbi:MAG TPA: outer membrane lipoprotein-sorting protein [Anaeromyxobacteraceae bacterium]|nr:outer membrane lipoprotein-sorting protein [Anaeromyxobacteraceae bacterium]
MARLGTALLLAALAALAGRAAALSQAETDGLVRTVDERQRSSGDYKALCYMEAKEKDKADVVYELLVYRREAEEKLMILFTKPKSEAGKGYLRLDKNLWLYDPATGRWERRTERERIGGTDTRRGDLDESRLAEEYTARWEAEEKLGAFTVQRVLLDVKPGVDVAFPRIRLWIDAASGNVLKRQELALSGRLMRTSYYPRWKRIYSESKKADVWFPEEMRIYDEVEKANSTLLLIRQVDLRPLSENMFTKAWLEAKSR